MSWLEIILAVKRLWKAILERIAQDKVDAEKKVVKNKQRNASRRDPKFDP